MAIRYVPLILLFVSFKDQHPEQNLNSEGKHGPAEAKAGNSKVRKHGLSNSKSGEATARVRKRISFRPTKTPRPFNPDFGAAKRSPEDIIGRDVLVTN